MRSTHFVLLRIVLSNQKPIFESVGELRAIKLPDSPVRMPPAHGHQFVWRAAGFSMLEPENPQRRNSVERVASRERVKRAIGRLSAMELVRLERFAKYRIRGLGMKAAGKTYEDLLSEAFTLTLSGARQWNPDNVHLVGYLCGVMRSISSHWGRSTVHEREWTEFAGSAEGEHLHSPIPDGEREASAKQEIDRIRGHFANDEMVLQLLRAISQGLKGPEIQAQMNISKTDFETIFRRLRRGAERIQQSAEDRTRYDS
jgi:hypothetical protein